VDLAIEKGPAPIMNETFEGGLTGKEYLVESGYMKRLLADQPALKEKLLKFGSRFTHHTSIAPTGTISLSLANNASNGIEPSFAHMYKRNVIKEGKNSKEQMTVYSYEALLWNTLKPQIPFPDYFMDAQTLPPKAHVDMQAAVQPWVDSAISKTINVPTDTPFEDFKDIYLYAYENGLKGCTTFRFNPEAFQGVLVTDKDLENTVYTFTLEDGSTVSLKGNETVEYDGQTHTAANLYDALKEGYYGKH
jgi:ribonucleoside-diphosphate reductase alpha chain